MTFEDRYASAVRSSNLRGKSDVQGAVDVLGAAGLAAKEIPLGMSLLRLLGSDDRHALREVVTNLADLAWGKARAERVQLRRPQAVALAEAVLAWYRHGACRACGKHGFRLMPGAPTIGNQKCPTCKGKGTIPFDREFLLEHLLVARWLASELERELGRVGPVAVEKLGKAFQSFQIGE